jgi:hypothetical protein
MSSLLKKARRAQQKPSDIAGRFAALLSVEQFGCYDCAHGTDHPMHSHHPDDRARTIFLYLENPELRARIVAALDTTR